MVFPMFSTWISLAVRFRLLVSKLLVRLGFREDSFLLLLALIVGILTAAAAVGFHWLIHRIRDGLFGRADPDFLYGKGIFLLVLWPAVGGLLVGVLGRWIFRAREGHGVIDVMESIVRSSGFQRPVVALEKIMTSAVTIGSGGSCGAEGPIVQIGAAIASGVGQIFRIARTQMPLLIGCGSAAGISAIFNSPIGGVLFTLEVIMQDFSIKTFVPVVLASVVANVTTQTINANWLHSKYEAIFAMPAQAVATQMDLSWRHLPSFMMLGLACGLLGVSFIKLMLHTEHLFARIKLPKFLKPALGGAMLGMMGVIYVMVFGWWLLKTHKPVSFEHYPLPAFFGDGYGAIQQMLTPAFYSQFSAGILASVLITFCIAKLIGTCLTVSSGGSGGVIAPALFLGAALGGLLGLILQSIPWFAHTAPEIYALVGMGAALAAVVHAPLASVLILVELTHDYKLVLPAMLATVVATGVARAIFRDSIYTYDLRQRGINAGSATDVLRRLFVEQVDLEPATTVQASDPINKLLDLSMTTGSSSLVVTNGNGLYAGLIDTEDMRIALLDPQVAAAMCAVDFVQPEVPTVLTDTDLASVLHLFSVHNVSHLPVCVPGKPGRVIGMISRIGVMRRYQHASA